MTAASTAKQIALQNILYATDFSEASETALPFAVSIAREYGAKIYVLHVLTPSAYMYSTPEGAAAGSGLEEDVQLEMQRVDSQLSPLPHEVLIERGASVWSALEQAIDRHGIDLIVVGTHGRTGAQKLALGSEAESIFRRSQIPVLTIGPEVRKSAVTAAKFHCVLFATDFKPESLGAAPFAFSLAEENQARLLLLHVVPIDRPNKQERRVELTAADVMYRLHELVPTDAELWCRPEPMMEFGEPAERILECAEQSGADLIVLGVRSAAGRLGAATHLERSTAHKIVAHSHCPVLTVRG
jgi:nucleotide-binding universal stress UspA family protein